MTDGIEIKMLDNDTPTPGNTKPRGDDDSSRPAPQGGAAPGETLQSGRYVRGEVIGRGGMATVYRAFDTVSERPVAIKILHAHLRDHALVVTRFRQEVAWVQRLDHPNIVRVHSLIDEPGALGMVMDLHEGGDLRRHLQRHGRMNWQDAVAVAVQVLDALQAAHAIGLVHHDVKPHNILLDTARDGGLVARLIDFGLAELDEALQIAHKDAVMGTVEYSAPELFDDYAVDARADLYGLAVALFEMLTGAPPYRGESAAAVIAMHRQAPVPDVRALADGVPEHVAQAIARAMAKNPTERFESAEQMRQALRGETAAGRLEQARVPLWDALLERYAGTGVHRASRWNVYVAHDALGRKTALVTMFVTPFSMLIRMDKSRASRLAPAQRSALQAVLHRYGGGELEEHGDAIGLAPFPLAYGLRAEEAEAVCEELRAAGIPVRRAPMATGPSDRPPGWMQTALKMIVALSLVAPVLAYFSLAAVIPILLFPPYDGLIGPVFLAFLAGLYTNSYALLDMGLVWTRAGEITHYRIVRDFDHQVSDAQLGAHHVEVYHRLGSQRVRDTYANLMQTLLAIRDRARVAQGFEQWTTAEIGALFDQAAALAHRIVELEGRIARLSTAALFEQIARLDAQIARTRDVDVTAELIDQKVALARELDVQDAARRELQTTGNRLLEMAARLHGIWIETGADARKSTSTGVELPRFVFDFEAAAPVSAAEEVAARS